MLGLFQCFLDVLVFPMPYKIHKEIILPLPLFIRTRSDIGHVNAVLSEHIQHINQGPGLVGCAEKNDGLVITAAQ